jgi:predicted DNA-binding transcriptional regulator AlpA
MAINGSGEVSLVRAPVIAQMLGVSDWVVYEMVRRRKIPGAINITNHTLRFNLSIVADWIARGCPPVEDSKVEAHG